MDRIVIGMGLDLSQIARVTLVVCCLYSAALAVFSWRVSTQSRMWGLGVSFATAAYAICTTGGFDSETHPWVIVLLFFCSALPAFYWAFVVVLFNDQERSSLIAVAVMVILGLLGVLASPVSGLPESIAELFAFARRLAGIGLIAMSLWSLAHGANNDLVVERWRARRWLLWVAGAYAILVLTVELLLSDAGVAPKWLAANLLAISVLTMSVGVLLTRWNLAPPLAAPPPMSTATPPQQIQRDNLAAVRATPPNPVADHILTNLEQAMVEEHLYRTEGLTIVKLADTLGTTEHRLRAVINQQLGFKNYNDFLHQYRLTDAARRLGDSAQNTIPILTIALEVGYGSIGPFNRAFKARFGETPSEFRKKHLPPS
jgi:AraC-like DNA-binding protein